MSSSGKRRSTPKKRGGGDKSPEAVAGAIAWANEALAVIFYSLALFVLIAFLAHEIEAGRITLGGLSSDKLLRNPLGPVGRMTGTILSGFMGWCALVPVAWAAMLGHYFWNTEDLHAGISSCPKLLLLFGAVGTLVFSCSLVGIFWGATGGGAIGTTVALPLVKLFSVAGAALITGALFLLSFAIATRRTVASLVEVSWRVGRLIGVFFLIVLPRALFHGLKVTCRFLWHSLLLLPRERDRSLPEDEAPLPKPRLRKNSVAAIEESPPVRKAVGTQNIVQERVATELTDQDDDSPDEESTDPEEDVARIVVKRRDAEERARAAQLARSRREPENDETEESPQFPGYQLPDVGLLTAGEPSVSEEDDDELRDKSRQIEAKLRDFGIYGKVTHVHPGPVITLFEFEPAAGVKVGKIAALQDDLAMSLRASSLRIIAPIPRRGTVGIEVPNKHRDIVRLRDVLESEAFLTADSILSVPLGKDTYGDPVVVDIATMPHLLMAGATGTGKSVCINAILLSLLYRASPGDLGLILIDPKILELSVYEDIPHLRVPVVTDPRQAKGVLQWAVNEMNRRYRMMQKFGVRNIDGYNNLVRGDEGASTSAVDASMRIDDIIQLPEESVVESGIVDPASTQDQGSESAEAEPLVVEQLSTLPKIVIVIDELADLMLTVGRDIEELITRLAQKARAAGIHLIIATQRPSVDVITGLIKANFPARLSFRVTARVDSRTILDQMGADKLLGRGDMLFMQPGAEAVRRVHGAFVSDAEVKKVVDDIKARAKPQYDDRIMEICRKALEEESQGETRDLLNEEGSDYDAVYDKAVELVLQRGQASTSMLQRAFRIGYNRAARIIEVMEREGIVGPMDGAKPREVIVPTHDNEPR